MQRSPGFMSPLTHFSRSLAVCLLLGTTVGCSISINSRTSNDAASEGKPKPDTKKPDTKKPDSSKPDTKKPDTKKPDTSKPDTKPEPEKPVITKPEPEKPVVKPEPEKPVITKPEPEKPVVKPEPEKPTSPLPEDHSRLVVPVRVPFETVVERIDALLPKTEQRDWTRVTKKGASPEVGVKYKVWRDPIQATFSGNTLRVVVPLRYAANVRVKIKNPLGDDWIWLTQNETWGTASNPQRMRITVDLTLTAENDWKVKSVSKLQGINHGAAPGGKICAKLGIDICTTKETIAPRVREELNDYLVPKIEAQLKKSDAQIEKALDLKKRAATLWAALQTPQQLQKAAQKNCPTQPGAACRQNAWLVVYPTTLGMSQINLSGDDLGVDLSIEGRVTTPFGARPLVKTRPLPALTAPASPTEVRLRTTLELPLSNLESALGRSLRDVSFPQGSSKLKVKGVKLALGAASARKIALTIQLEGSDPIVVEGKLDYDSKKKALALTGVEFDAATEARIKGELKGLDVNAVKKRVLDAAVWKLDQLSSDFDKAVRTAMNQTLPGQLEVKGELDDVSLSELSLKDDVIVARVELVGSLGIEYSPR